jgi:hypothetical protein
MARNETNSISDEDLLYKIEALGRRQVLVLTVDDQIVIDGLTSDLPPDSAAWACKGGGMAFFNCTKKIVDNSGCAVIVVHEDGYCSKPCRD